MIPPEVHVSPSDGRWAAWGPTPKRSWSCPGSIMMLDKRTGRATIRGWICGSPQHRYDACGPVYAQKHLDHLVPLIEAEESIFFADCDYEPNLLNRLDQRRIVHGGEKVVIRRYRGRVGNQCSRYHIYSTVPLPGRLQPTEWTQLTSEEAVEHLANRSFSIPGLYSRKGLTPITYSAGWKPAKDENEEGEEGKSEYLGIARRESTLRHALTIMDRTAETIFGIRPVPPDSHVSYHQIPSEYRGWWVDETRRVVESLEHGGDGTPENLRANASEVIHRSVSP